MNKIKPLLKSLALAFIMVFITNCSDDSSSKPEVNYKKLNEAFSSAQQIENLTSLVVFHNDTIIKEAFFGTGGADVRQSVRSVTKSVMSILIGIAIDKRYLSSIDQTLGEFIDTSVYTISLEKSAIKISHLLSMTGGFEWNELTANGYNEWTLADNQVQYLLDKPLIAEPGQLFTYNSAGTHLLSYIITKATGMSTYEFSLQYLFNPMDVEEVDWYIDKQGYCNGGAGLIFTPHDMVKIGQLVLYHGVFNGKTIIPADYVNNSVLSKVSTDNTMNFASGYGYCWWLGQKEGIEYVFANGYGGQFIVIVPSLELIVVATNSLNGVTASVANEQWFRTLDLIINSIIPAFN
jgi:CubicO group peptidase (beta-lactamase class C family)